VSTEKLPDEKLSEASLISVTQAAYRLKPGYQRVCMMMQNGEVELMVGS
jgi:hypothetical protein